MTLAELFRLDGKIVAVIGAASGIGEAVAVGCAEVGGRVHCLDLDGVAAEGVAARIRDGSGSADASTLDIRDATQVAEAFDRIHTQDRRLDVVICTPGINVRKPLLSYTEEEFDRVVQLNLKGSFLALREAGRIMTVQRMGSIILFSSIRSQVVEPGQGVYAATKAGIVQLVRAGATEFGPAGVRVNAVAPGIVETPLTQPIRSDTDWYQAYASKSVFGRWATAREMAGPTVFLASDAASYVTGTVLYADGGWTAADGRFAPPDGREDR